MNPKNDIIVLAINVAVVIVACAAMVITVIITEIFFPWLPLGVNVLMDFIAGCVIIGLFFLSGLYEKVVNL